MNCPECKTVRLSPARLEPTLAAHGCAQCDGALLDLVAYRLWSERHAHEAEASVQVAPAPEAEKAALLCARCDRIMLRFRYTAETPHVLDVCTYCDDVWLQGNEWGFLKRLSLHGGLTQIFTDPWQRELRSERTRRVLDEDWDRKLGEQLHDEVREMREWLDTHPSRDLLLDYLRSDDPYAV